MKSAKKLAGCLILPALVLAGCQSVPSDKGAISVKPPPVTGNDAYYAVCNGRQTSLEDLLQSIVDDMVAQKIPYSTASNEWRDCSGNFLRLSSYIAGKCPELNGSLAATAGVRDYRAGDNNSAEPAKAIARSTRDIAKLYSEDGQFIPILYSRDGSDKETLAGYREYIKPGAVLWFAHKKPTNSTGVEMLISRQINHMGTVVSVTRDPDGNVVSYRMYHGRSSGKNATVTGDHYWDWPRRFTTGGKKYPPLGYWSQYLVAIAPLPLSEEPILAMSAH